MELRAEDRGESTVPSLKTVLPFRSAMPHEILTCILAR